MLNLIPIEDIVSENAGGMGYVVGVAGGDVNGDEDGGGDDVIGGV